MPGDLAALAGASWRRFRSASTPSGADRSGPGAHALASSPLETWAEWLRQQEVHDPEDLEGVAAALGAVLLAPTWGPETLPLVDLPEALVLSDDAGALDRRCCSCSGARRKSCWADPACRRAALAGLAAFGAPTGSPRPFALPDLGPGIGQGERRSRQPCGPSPPIPR